MKYGPIILRSIGTCIELRCCLHQMLPPTTGRAIQTTLVTFTISAAEVLPCPLCLLCPLLCPLITTRPAESVLVLKVFWPCIPCGHGMCLLCPLNNARPAESVQYSKYFGPAVTKYCILALRSISIKVFKVSWPCGHHVCCHPECSCRRNQRGEQTKQ